MTRCIAAVIAAVVLLAGCSGTDYRELTSAQMCGLVKRDEVAVLLNDKGGYVAKPEQRDRPYCNLEHDKTMTFALSLYETTRPIRAEKVAGGEITDVDVAGEAAFLQKISDTTCTVFVPLEEGLYLDVTVDTHADLAACPVAHGAAQAAYPRLTG